MRNGKVSIIVPVYNVEKYVGRCIESIITQTYTNLEILINNDGSTDNSYEICSIYTKKDSRIKLFTQKNSGVSTCRNKMLDVATGDYITFVDPDDWLLPSHIEQLVILLEEHNADISACAYMEEKNGNIKKCIKHEKICCFDSKEFAIKMTTFWGGYYCFLWNRLSKKELWDDVRFPDGRIYEDLYVMPKLVLKADTVVYTNIPTYIYQIRENSISHSPFRIARIDELDGYIYFIRYGYENDCFQIVRNGTINFIYFYLKIIFEMRSCGKEVSDKYMKMFKNKYKSYFNLFLKMFLTRDFSYKKEVFDELKPLL